MTWHSSKSKWEPLASLQRERAGRRDVPCQKDAEEGTAVEARTGDTLQAVAGGESSTDDSPEHGAVQTGKGSREEDP